MTRSKIILIVVGIFGVLLLVTSAHFILSPRHLDGTVPATASAANTASAAPLPADGGAASSPSAASDPPNPEGTESAAPEAEAPSTAPLVNAAVEQAKAAAQAPSATPTRASAAAEPATVHKQPTSADAYVFRPGPIPPALEQDFLHKSFVKDPLSGNYMGPKLSARTLREPLVPVPIGGKNAVDLRGHVVFLRQTIRDKNGSQHRTGRLPRKVSQRLGRGGP